MYDDLVDHDVRWGELAYAYIKHWESDGAPYIIFRGPERIYRLTTAESYMERRSLLDDVENVTAGGGATLPEIYLNRHLNEVGTNSVSGAIPAIPTFDELTAEQKTACIGRSYCDDDHSDEVIDIWERAYGKFHLNHIGDTGLLPDYGLCGYFFWNRRRIPEIIIMKPALNMIHCSNSMAKIKDDIFVESQEEKLAV
ncbi:hypothetical protein F4776DRAFT_336948 [Hypoxylon sp. NC0597]|nr:hypothetical protein F4776DRAFT_336948 [Hypoxylon sp. NC0597]